MAPVLVAALLARVAAAAALGNQYQFADEAVYHDAARALLRGDLYLPGYGAAPGQPLVLAILSTLTPDSLVALRIAHAAVTAVGVLCVYRLGTWLAGAAAATAAALIYALDPLLALAGGLLYAEAFAGVLLTAAVLLALTAARRDAVSRSAATGLLVAAVALFRPVALLLAPVIAAWIAWAVPPRLVRRSAHLAAFALSWALLLAPWTWRNFRIHDRLVPIAVAGVPLPPLGGDTVESRSVSGTLLERARRDPLGFGRRVALEFGHFWELAPTRLMTDDPVRRATLHRHDARLPTQPLLSRSLRDWVSAASFGVELVLALAGLVLVWRTRRREAALLVGVTLSFALGYALFYGKLRYRIPVLPLVFVFSGAAAAALIERMAARRRGPG